MHSIVSDPSIGTRVETHPVSRSELRQHGLDVTTTGSAGMNGAKGHAQLNAARSHRRLLITKNQGFRRYDRQEVPRCGILLSRADPEHHVAMALPRTRVTEAEIDRQVLAIFDKMRIEDEGVREWFRAVLRSQTKDAQADSLAQRAELQRQITLAVNQQNRLVDLRIGDEIDADVFAAKQSELRDRIANLKLQLDVVDRSHDEMSDLAVKVFELSQTLRQQWLTADYATKRRIMEIVFLNCRLDDATLVPTMRKPFDVLAEGLLVQSSRGDRI